MKKYKIGYTQGTYDMFHIGHLNLLNNAKELCEYLIVGVNSDSLVKEFKNKLPVVAEKDRRDIVESIKSVDMAVIASTLDKLRQWGKFKFDAVFVGDDWKDSPRWIETKKILSQIGVDVVFLPYTQRISSTALRDVWNNRIRECDLL